MCGRSVWSTELRKAAAAACIAACSFAAAWGIALAFPGPFDELNGNARELLQVVRYRLGGRGAVSPRLVHVVVTDRSRQELGMAGWDRQAFGRALEILQGLEARTIVCDIFFREESFGDNDRALIQAARGAAPVFFPVFLSPRPAGAAAEGDPAFLDRCTLAAAAEHVQTLPSADHLVPPFPDLARAAARFGHINLEPDHDGVNRRVPLLYRHRGALIPSLALAGAMHYLGVEPANVLVSPGSAILLKGARLPGGAPSDISIPVDRACRMLVDPVGPWEDSFPTVPIQAVLAAGTDAETRSGLHDLVQGSLVVLSDISTMNRDYGPGIFERTYPLSGLHLEVANGILTSRFLAAPGVPASVIASLLLAAALAAATRLRGLAFPGAIALLYALFLAAAYGSLAGLRLVPDVAVPTVGFLAAAAALVVFRVVAAERERSAAEVTLRSNHALARLNTELAEQGRSLQGANARLREMEHGREQAAQAAARRLRGPLDRLLQSMESVWTGHRGRLTPSMIEDLQVMRREAGDLVGLVNQLLDGGAVQQDDAQPEGVQEAGAVQEADRGAGVGSILLVGDDPHALDPCAAALRSAGVATIEDGCSLEGVHGALRLRPYCAAILDYGAARLAAAGLISRIRDESPSVRLIVLADPAEIPAAVECIRQGASDYLVKPLEPREVVSAVQRCLEGRTLGLQVSALGQRLDAMELTNPAAFSRILTRSPRMVAVFRRVEELAADSDPVLITGESGVGKELLADVIHKLSGRKGPYVPENVAGLDDAMITDTLFGHLRGSFTDAREARRGLVDEAAGGTLFLDEIGDLPPGSQVKLLRLIEGGEFRPLGSDTVRTSSARIVAATNVDLASRLKEGAFREDLYHRFTHRVHVPPLRERAEDLPLLVEHFARECAAARGRDVPTVPDRLVDLLRAYPFPGNIRELRNMVDNALRRSSGPSLLLDHFREQVQAGPAGPGGAGAAETARAHPAFGAAPTLKEAERRAIAEALEQAGGNQNLAARLLGLSPSALSRRLRKERPPA